jgi:hypothetical protein
VSFSTRKLIIYPTPSLLRKLTGGVFFHEKTDYLSHPLSSNKADRGCFASTRKLIIYPTPSLLMKLTGGVFFYEKIDCLPHPLFSNKADRRCLFPLEN